MKNYLLAFMLLLAFGVFAQSTHTIDFEPAGTGAGWTWEVAGNVGNLPLEFVANPDNAGINTSATTAKFTALDAGADWALCYTDGDGEFTFDATNSIVKIMVFKPVISNVGVKFEGFSGAIEILIPNTLINQWEEITFDFSAKIGSTYSRIVIIPDFAGRTEDHIVYFDNIQVPDGTIPTPPGEPGTVPPIPTHAQADVLSIYSEAYTNLAGTNFNPNWNQSTGVTVDYVAAGNKTLRYQNLNYQGTAFENHQDVSGYEYIHLDFWTPNSTVLRFFLISPGNETFYPLPITPETWVSLDIPLTHFVPPVNLADVFQFKVDGNGTVFFDNWYFWKTPSSAGTDASLSDLQVDGVTVPGFAPNIFSYDVELPLGTTIVPPVTATTTNPNATFVVNDALALPGTTEVVVTAEDGISMKTYAINFTVAGLAPTSDYCATLVYHFGIAAELPSAIYLTIKNLDALSMIVEIESATADPVDLLIVTGGSGATISVENTSVPGKISRILSWASNPPADVTLNVLWSKASFGGNWMLIQGDFSVPFEAVCEPAPPAAITFSVDMSDYAGAFTNVYVSGSFNGWSGDANQMLDPDMDDVYVATLMLENGNYEYKFTLDNWVGGQEEFQGGEPCVITVGGYHNRALTVTGTNELPVVCWNSCYACGYVPPTYDVTFNVNMSQYAGAFTNVYLSGSMNGWCGTCNQLTDANMDGIYDVTLNLAEGNYEYKFTLDNQAVWEQFVGGEWCTSTIGGYTNRTINVNSATVLPEVCWNSCDVCPILPTYYDVTFKVDMSQYSGAFNEVDLNGSFNNWCGSCNPLTDANADNVYEVTLPLVEGTTYQYKFTLDGWSHQEEFVPGDPCTSTIGGYTNRTIYITEPMVLPAVCWNLCDLCPTYKQGWSGISSNLILDSKMSMEDVFAPVLDDLVILLGLHGMFWPAQGINTLDEWDTYQGYKVKFENDVFFEFTGTEPTDRKVTVYPGMVYVPVLSQGPVLVQDVIMPLGSDILFMFDISSGEVYWPDGGLVPPVNGSLQTLYPGSAYLTRVMNQTVIDFGATLPKSGYPTRPYYQDIQVTGWNQIMPTGSQHIISLATATLISGDVVGAFNSNGICVGKATFNGIDKMIPLIVSGDDETTQNIDGMTAGEEMSFRIYRNGQEFSVTAVYDKSVEKFDGLYAENGLSIIRELKSGTTGIISQQKAAFSIFPNPGNGQIFINLTKEGIYDLSVSSSQGLQVFSTVISGSQNLDLSTLSKGVYFIKVSDVSTVTVEKMVIR